MSRINVSELNATSALSNDQMNDAVGGLRRVVCRPEVRLVKVRLPFGIVITVPKLVIVCRVR